MTGTRPGWYVDDPEHPRTLRWHDGARWTQHTRADTDPDTPPGPPPHPPAWTPAYGPPGTYPPPGPPPPPPVLPPLPEVGTRPDAGQRQALVALGVISGLLLVAIVVVIALLATYDDDDQSSSAADPRPPAAVPAPVPDPTTPAEPAADSPEAVAEAFLTALLDGRCQDAVGYLAAELRPPGDACAQLPLPQGLGDLAEADVGNATLDGDEALVPAGFVPAGETEPLPGTRFVLVMVREDGAWRVTSIETK